MIKIIVATDENLLIGKEGTVNGMPWNVPEDLKFFKETTINQTIVMGSTTYKAIGRPLPQRKTIVVSRSGFVDERVEVCGDLIAVINDYKQRGEDLFICGGASIYKQALPYCDELIISRIPGVYSGETYFPSFDEYPFTCTEVIPFETFKVERFTK